MNCVKTIKSIIKKYLWESLLHVGSGFLKILEE